MSVKAARVWLSSWGGFAWVVSAPGFPALAYPGWWTKERAIMAYRLDALKAKGGEML